MLLSIALSTVTGCGISIPTDPDGSLARIHDGILRVGVSHSEPWVYLHDEAKPTGTEVELVKEFADSLNSQVQWTPGGEASLMESMNNGELDMVVAGLTDKTPWAENAGITRPYTESVNSRGEAEKHVMAVPMGENALLSRLENFLDHHDDTSESTRPR